MHRRNDFYLKIYKKLGLYIDIDLKIILLDCQNNYIH